MPNPETPVFKGLFIFKMENTYFLYGNTFPIVDSSVPY
jgi:hypothetical protein